jgi:hypothetical protein
MISIAHDTLTDDFSESLLSRKRPIRLYGNTIVLSSSGWQKYYVITDNTVWNPIPLNSNLFNWYATGTFNAWPSTSISSLDLTQYVGIAVLTSLNIPDSIPVNLSNTAVTRISLTGWGSYAGILNDGSLSTTNGSDVLTGASNGVGAVNGLGGSGGTGILNKQYALLNTRGGNDRINGSTTGSGGSGILNYGQVLTEDGYDRIIGSTTGSGGSGILNYGQILTEDGVDNVYGYASGIGTRFGIENRNGLIETGSGRDRIQGTGNNAIGGIANGGFILSGDGNDFILGQVTNDSGGFSVGIANSNGVIDAGSGSDTISGTAMGVWSVGIANSNYGSIDGGIGSITDIDTITGTATGDFSVGIVNQGGTINVNGGLTPSQIILNGVANGNNSVGIRNSFFGASLGTIATGNDADIITGSATGDYSVGIVNEGFYISPDPSSYVFAEITNTGDKMGQIIGTASGTNSTGIVNNGLIDMSSTTSSDGVVIQGTSDGRGESRGIMNGYNIYTGSGNDVITGQTTGGGFGILNVGRIDTGAGNDSVTSIGDFGGSRFLASDGLFLGTGNDTLSGFGNNGYFDGGADIDKLILPRLNSGQSYLITKEVGSLTNSATIQRSSEFGTSNVMYIDNFETFAALGSTYFTASSYNFAGQLSSFSIFY